MGPHRGRENLRPRWDTVEVFFYPWVGPFHFPGLMLRWDNLGISQHCNLPFIKSYLDECLRELCNTHWSLKDDQDYIL